MDAAGLLRVDAAIDAGAQHLLIDVEHDSVGCGCAGAAPGNAVSLGQEAARQIACTAGDIEQSLAGLRIGAGHDHVLPGAVNAK